MRKALVAKAAQHADVRAANRAGARGAALQCRLLPSGDKSMLGKLWMQVRDRVSQSGEFDALSRPLAPPWE